MKDDDGPEFFKSIKDLAHDFTRKIEKRLEDNRKGKTTISGIPTGFADIDKITDGLPYGLTVVGARPEDGLTDFGLNVALNASQTHNVAYFVPDIPPEVIMQRVISRESRVPFNSIIEGVLGERDFPKLTDALGKIVNTDSLNFYYSKLSQLRFYDLCKHAQEEHGAQLIILDRLQSLFPKESIGRVHSIGKQGN